MLEISIDEWEVTEALEELKAELEKLGVKFSE